VEPGVERLVRARGVVAHELGEEHRELLVAGHERAGHEEIPLRDPDEDAAAGPQCTPPPKRVAPPAATLPTPVPTWPR